MSVEEMNRLPKEVCAECHLRIRGGVLPVHKFLQHGIPLPDLLSDRIDDVIAHGFPTRAPPQITVAEEVAAVAREYAEYFTPEPSPEEEEEQQEQEDEEEEDSESGSESGNELGQFHGSQYDLLKMYLTSSKVWKEYPYVRSVLEPKNFWTNLPRCLIPQDAFTLAEWSELWHEEKQVSQGSHLHFVIASEAVLVVLSTRNLYPGRPYSRAEDP